MSHNDTGYSSCAQDQIASVGEIRVPAAYLDFRAGDCALKFTLTYEGTLKTGGPKADRKHDRRKEFHSQLKRLWEVNSLLAHWTLPVDKFRAAPASEVLAQRHAKLGAFEFVPLITRELAVEAALQFHILRPTTFKGQNADPDNIVKVLVDSLKMPQNNDELPHNSLPLENEKPLYVLMQDDSLVSKITSTSDELLYPIKGKSQIDRSDTRIMIEVYIRPNFPKNENLIFFSDDFEVWNHQWTAGIPIDTRGWSNSELKARTTQCVIRMRVTASNFRMQRSGQLRWHQFEVASISDEERRIKWENESRAIMEQSDEQNQIWNNRLRPIAMALKEELLRRIHGEKPYPSDSRMRAIDNGILAGVDPIGEAASGLESLIRQLP